MRPGLRVFAVASAVLLVAPLVAVARSRSDPPVGARALPASPAESVAATIAEAASADALAALRPPARGIRVALISSGVDADALDSTSRERISRPWGTRDAIGYGTYAASVLLEIADVHIVSLDAYGAGQRVHPGALAASLDWALAHVSDLDVVLLAVPPHEMLDPISGAMAAGTWREVLDAGADHPVASTDGSLFGIAFGEAGRAQRQSMPADRRGVVEAFVTATERWSGLREQIRRLESGGVALVAPAGDVGPNLQTILGPASLPEVITVGGFDGRGPSATSASGPSIDGRVKPDLVVSTGVPGRLATGSAIAQGLASSGLLAMLLGDRVDGGSVALLDTTFGSAAVAAAAVGSLHRQGVADVDRQRGALVAASEPLAGVPVWRQGAGVLRFAPDAALARSRPLALGHGDLGAEPAAGRWRVRVPLSAPASGRPSVALSHFAGVGPDGRTYTRPTSDAPPLSARVTERGVEISAPLGEDRYEGGLYCGYTTVPVPTTGAGVAARVVIRGAPEGVEHVPTCLVEGTRLRSFGFYIHDMPAPDLTFALLPALPEGASLLERPFMLLPVDPFHTKLFFAVTGPDGYADFPNVPPGNFLVRLFSDYGSPVVQTVTDSETGEAVRIEGDIGENPSYSSFEALVLSAVGWSEQDLRDRFGTANVTPDAPTGTYWVRVGDRRLRVVLGFLKDKPGASVSSRYVDLLSYEDLDFASVLGPLDPERIATLPTLKPKSPWAFGPAPGDPDGVLAAFNPAALVRGDVLGIARYPFNLTTPNYKAHMSLNFSYELKNAVVGVVVKIGGDVASGMVTPEVAARPADLELLGPTSGVANFEFNMLPQGARTGELYLVFVPSPAVQSTVPSVATATVDDLSFELDTWQRVPWPAVFHEGHGMGHAFSFEPNYSERQMSAPGCRDVSAGGIRSEVCEEWQVLVHSPGDDAATVDVHGGRGVFGVQLRRLGLYADPRRGVSDFSSELAFVLDEPGVPVELALRLPSRFRTNGRFWEQLVLGREALSRHPGRITVLIVDNLRGRSSGLAPRVRGGVPVAPYVPFVSDAGASQLPHPPALPVPLPL